MSACKCGKVLNMGANLQVGISGTTHLRQDQLGACLDQLGAAFPVKVQSPVMLRQQCLCGGFVVEAGFDSYDSGPDYATRLFEQHRYRYHGRKCCSNQWIGDEKLLDRGERTQVGPPVSKPGQKCKCGVFTILEGYDCHDAGPDTTYFRYHYRRNCDDTPPSNPATQMSAHKGPSLVPAGVSEAKESTWEAECKRARESERGVMVQLKRQQALNARLQEQLNEARQFADRYREGKIERVRQLRLHPVAPRNTWGGAMDHLIDLDPGIGHIVVLSPSEGISDEQYAEQQADCEKRLGAGKVVVIRVPRGYEVTICEIVRGKG